MKFSADKSFTNHKENLREEEEEENKQTNKQESKFLLHDVILISSQSVQ